MASIALGVSGASTRTIAAVTGWVLPVGLAGQLQIPVAVVFVLALGPGDLSVDLWRVLDVALGAAVAEQRGAQPVGLDVVQRDAGQQVGHGASVGLAAPRIAAATADAGRGSSRIV